MKEGLRITGVISYSAVLLFAIVALAVPSEHKSTALLGVVVLHGMILGWLHPAAELRAPLLKIWAGLAALLLAIWFFSVGWPLLSVLSAGLGVLVLIVGIWQWRASQHRMKDAS